MNEKGYRRNEDRSQDEKDAVRKEEILAEDYGRMHGGGNHLLAVILRTLIWIAIIFVFIKLLQKF